MTNTVAVGERDGKVILSFPELTNWVALDPETARRMAEAIARESYQIKYGVKPEPNRSAIAEAKYAKCVNAATHIIRSLVDKHEKPGRISVAVVDMIFQEVM